MCAVFAKYFAKYYTAVHLEFTKFFSATILLLSTIWLLQVKSLFQKLPTDAQPTVSEYI